MSNDDVVHIDNIRKTFGRTIAIDKLDMRIKAGEFVTFLGPSGCGKSTTLRIMGGFESPDHGRIWLNGEDITRQPPNRRHINMVFQDYALFPHMTARANIAFGLELKGMAESEISKRTSELASFLELEAYIDRFPDQLSGGQRQRVALARALAPDPAMLLLDEPLAALDAKLRNQVQLELKAIQRRTGKTFFFVTHDQDEAMTMSDRIIVMNEGRVEQDGTPQELYHHPENAFVASFIGETNLIEARVLQVQGQDVTLEWHGLQLRGKAQKHTPQKGQIAKASLRLEDILISPQPTPCANSFQAQWGQTVFKGSRSSVELQLADRIGACLKAFVDARQAGDGQAWIGFDADALTLLRD